MCFSRSVTSSCGDTGTSTSAGARTALPTCRGCPSSGPSPRSAAATRPARVSTLALAARRSGNVVNCVRLACPAAAGSRSPSPQPASSQRTPSGGAGMCRSASYAGREAASANLQVKFCKGSFLTVPGWSGTTGLDVVPLTLMPLLRSHCRL